VKDVKYVLVWGTSARHYPQHCGLSHVLNDEDVVQIVKKKVRNLPLILFHVVLTDWCTVLLNSGCIIAEFEQMTIVLQYTVYYKMHYCIVEYEQTTIFRDL
jgi:hypothetical protein